MRLENLLARVLSLDASALRDSDGPATIETWDSLNHVVLAGAVEEEFGLTFSSDELLAINSLGDFRRILREKGCDV